MPLLDFGERRGSSVILSSLHRGVPPRNKGAWCRRDPLTVEEIVAVMGVAGEVPNARESRPLWPRLGMTTQLAHTPGPDGEADVLPSWHEHHRLPELCSAQPCRPDRFRVSSLPEMQVGASMAGRC